MRSRVVMTYKTASYLVDHFSTIICFNLMSSCRYRYPFKLIIQHAYIKKKIREWQQLLWNVSTKKIIAVQLDARSSEIQKLFLFKTQFFQKQKSVNFYYKIQMKKFEKKPTSVTLYIILVNKIPFFFLLLFENTRPS